MSGQASTSYVKSVSDAVASCFNETNLSCTSSLCGKFFLLSQTNSWLYPSNAKITKVGLNSINELLKDDKLIGVLNQKEEVEFFFPKPVVYLIAEVGKLGAGLLSVVVVSPIGVVINGSLTVFHVACYAERKYGLLSKEDKEQASAEWQKASKCAVAVLLDAAPALETVMAVGLGKDFVSWFCIPLSICEWASKKPGEKISEYILKGAVQGLFYHFVIPSLPAISIPTNSSLATALKVFKCVKFFRDQMGRNAIKTVIPYESKAGIMRSTILRQELGLVNLDGFLTQVDSIEDYSEFDEKILSLMKENMSSFALEFEALDASERKAVIDDNKWEGLSETLQQKRAIIDCTQRMRSQIDLFDQGPSAVYPQTLDGFLTNLENGWKFFTEHPVIKKFPEFTFENAKDQEIFDAFKSDILAGKNLTEILSKDNSEIIYNLLSLKRADRNLKDEEAQALEVLIAFCGCRMVQLDPESSVVVIFRQGIQDFLKAAEQVLESALRDTLSKEDRLEMCFAESSPPQSVFFDKIDKIKEKFGNDLNLRRSCEDFKLFKKTQMQIELLANPSVIPTCSVPACLNYWK